MSDVHRFVFEWNRRLIRSADLDFDDGGVATVHRGEIPKREQAWFVDELPGSDEHVVATRIEPDVEGRLVAVEVRIFPRAWLDDGVGAWGLFRSAPHAVEGLTSTKVRRALVGSAVKDARRIVDAFAAKYPEWTFLLRVLNEWGWDGKARAQEASRDLSRRPGRRGRSDLNYLPIAVRYAELVAAGDPTPVKTMAAENEGRPGMTDLVRRCRERGLLTKGNQGRAGGALTDKALRLLEEQEGRSGEH